MKLSHRVLAAAGVAAAGIAVATPATAAPHATTTNAASAAERVDALVAARPAALHASKHDAFVAGSVVTSGNARYAAYERTYKGLPVVGGDFVVVTDGAGNLVHTSVAQDRALGEVSTTPTLTKGKAESIARAQLRTVTEVEGSRLVVLADSSRLAWETVVDGTGAEGDSRLTVDVDAVTGQVLRTDEHVTHGTGTGGFNGPNPLHLDTTQAGTKFSMVDPTVGNLSCGSGKRAFSGSDDAWGDGNSTSLETGCVDALYGAQTENKMLSQWLGRNSFDGAGGGWPIKVGLNAVNAYYNGREIAIGHNQANQWISSMDVVAHEFGHGIDDKTPGGISRGGTQEFIADTFGAATEAFANQPTQFDAPDYLVGEEINLVGAGPIRNMYNPSLKGHANCYSSAIPSTEVHAAAGPGNHWFYLLAEGSNPTNGQPASPTCNNSAVTGIGVQKAITVLYNAMLMKTTTSNYLTYRTWTLQAAKNLYPGSCAEFNTVKAAWDAVSVPAQAAEPTC
ncbi:MAG TPA: M4 family metallopeptidase [Actinokineospora sp.]|nr:M4 family metallopeptidase [Actinokineospora sp.]